MALANYVDLQASILTWTNRPDLTTLTADFVTLAESQIARDLRLRKQITATNLATVANAQSVTLPTDWLEFENVSILDSGGVTRQLTYVNVEHLGNRYPPGGTTNTPRIYTIEGDNLQLGPVPDAVYSIPVIYYARFGALATSSTNWLMTTHPSIYLYQCLRQAALYLMNDAGAVKWGAMYGKEVVDLQDQDDAAQHSGSALRVRQV